MFRQLVCLAALLCIGCITDKGGGDGGVEDPGVNQRNGPDEPGGAVDSLLVPAACNAGDELELTVAIERRGHGLSAESRVGDARLGERLGHADFRVSEALAEVDGETGAVGVEPVGLEYQWTGGEARKRDDLLVVLAMDHSGSLVGQDPRTLDIDLVRASDRRDERITFFQQLVGDLDEAEVADGAQVFLSLISFNGSFANVDPSYASPTLNRDVIREGLELHSRAEEGLTPLADGMKAALDRILLASGNEDLRPVLVLFTDGVEVAADGSAGGDTSTASLWGEDGDVGMVRRYEDAGVPVIVVHLQSAVNAGFARGRDPDLVDLACRTGGDYFFVERAEEFTQSPSLLRVIRDRIFGAWKLRVSAPEAPEGQPWLLSGQLSLEVGGASVEGRFEASESNIDHEDGRLWFPR